MSKSGALATAPSSGDSDTSSPRQLLKQEYLRSAASDKAVAILDASPATARWHTIVWFVVSVLASTAMASVMMQAYGSRFVGIIGSGAVTAVLLFALGVPVSIIALASCASVRDSIKAYLSSGFAYPLLRNMAAITFIIYVAMVIAGPQSHNLSAAIAIAIVGMGVVGATSVGHALKNVLMPYNGRERPGLIAITRGISGMLESSQYGIGFWKSIIISMMAGYVAGMSGAFAGTGAVWRYSVTAFVTNLIGGTILIGWALLRARFGIVTIALFRGSMNKALSLFGRHS